jgi:hypothetical protein
MTIGSRAQVFHGTALRTSGGLTKDKLMKNRHGRIVSKKMHANGQKALARLAAAGYSPFQKGSNKVQRKRR